MTFVELKKKAAAFNEKTNSILIHDFGVIKQVKNADRLKADFNALGKLADESGMYKIGETDAGNELVDPSGQHWMLTFPNDLGDSLLYPF